jgi:hypothetical protein
MEAKRLTYDSLEAIAHVGLAQLLADADAKASWLCRAFPHVEYAKERILIELAVLVDILKLAAQPDASAAREFKRHSLASGAEAHAPFQLFESFRSDPADL